MKVFITTLIIFGIGLGTGVLTFGVMMASNYRDISAGYVAAGAGILAGSTMALVAHLFGGFRDLDSDRYRDLDDPDA